MLNKRFYLLVLLFIPFFTALAETDKTVKEVNHIFRESLFSGSWMAFKLLWPYIVIAILIKITYVFLDNKIKNWKNKKKGNQKKF